MKSVWGCNYYWLTSLLTREDDLFGRIVNWYVTCSSSVFLDESRCSMSACWGNNLGDQIYKTAKLIVLSQVVDFILVYWQKRTSEVEKCRFFFPTHWLQLLKCERSLLFCIVVIWIYLCLLADLDQLKSVKILRRSPGTWHGQKRTNTQAIERKKNQEINMENDRQMPP